MVLTWIGCRSGHLFQFRFHECDLVLRATGDSDPGGETGMGDHVPIRLSSIALPRL